jgi:hypothetical protein
VGEDPAIGGTERAGMVDGLSHTIFVRDQGMSFAQASIASPSPLPVFLVVNKG